MYNGTSSSVKYIENGSATKTVTSWTLDATLPSKPTVSCSAENVYCNSTTKTIYYKSGVNSITITPSSTDTGGSGVKGYALSPTGTPATSITVPESGSAIPSSITVYAFDNVGNSNSETFTLTMDNAKPTIERAAGENSLDGCIPVGGNLFFKDGNAKLKIKVTDTGSGLKSGSSYLTLDENSEVWIKLSDYVSTSGVVTIPNPSNSSTKGVSDNVGNAYTSDSPYQLTGLVVKEDSTPPSEPTSVSDAGSACLDTSSGIVVYYNGTTTAVTLTLVGADDGTNGSGVTGYTVDGISDVESTAITVTIPVSGFAATQSVSIKSKDGVGNESAEALSVTFKKDAAAPEVSISSLSGGKTFAGDSTIYFKDVSTDKAHVVLSITEPRTTDSGLAGSSNSWQDGKTLNLSDSGVLNSDGEVAITSGAVKDKVGNTTAYTLKYGEKTFVMDDEAPGTPSVTTVAVTGAGAKYHKDGNTIYYNDATTKITITPTASDNSGGCGVAGYATSATGTPTATVAIPGSGTTIPSSVSIYAIDNLGKASETPLVLYLKKDADEPSVSIDSIDGGKRVASGSTIYFKDVSDTDKAHVVLSITEPRTTDSGLAGESDSWQDGKTLNLSDTGVLNSDGKIAIESGSIKDNVGNTTAYVIGSNVFIKDVIGPSAPTGFKVTATAGTGSQYLVNGTAGDDGYYSATGTKVFYNGSTTSLTFAIKGGNADTTGGCGWAGYALSDDAEPNTTSVTVDVSDDPTSVVVYSYDKLGNKSAAFTIAIEEDVTPPEFNRSVTVDKTLTAAKIRNNENTSDYELVVYPEGMTITVPIANITETGSGLKSYAWYTSVGGEYVVTMPSSWTDFTEEDLTNGVSYTPDTTDPETHIFLLVKDNVDNVIQSDFIHASAVKPETTYVAWWYKEDNTVPSATYKQNGGKLEVTLSGAKMPITSISVLAGGITKDNSPSCNLTYLDDRSSPTQVKTYQPSSASFSSTPEYGNSGSQTGRNTVTISFGSTGYISYDGSVKIVLDGYNPTFGAVPTIKVNGTALTSVASANTFSGFIRHNLPGLETVVGGSGSQRGTFVTERFENLADYFTALSHASLDTERVDQIAFNIGKNMENGGELKKEEKIVTADEIRGYGNEASVAEDLPLTLQNNAWQAPNGTVPEDSEQILPTEHLAQLNPTLEFGSPNKVLTATDAPSAHQMEENRVRTSALVLALLSLCAAGVSAVLFRRRRSS